jgi:hypothetical protein
MSQLTPQLHASINQLMSGNTQNQNQGN